MISSCLINNLNDIGQPYLISHVEKSSLKVLTIDITFYIWSIVVILCWHQIMFSSDFWFLL